MEHSGKQQQRRPAISGEQERLVEELRQMLRELYSRDQDEIHGRVIEFHDHLKKRYSDARHYRLFHLISGSTLLDCYGQFDFEGDDSIARFIRQEYRDAFGEEEQEAFVA